MSGSKEQRARQKCVAERAFIRDGLILDGERNRLKEAADKTARLRALRQASEAAEAARPSKQ